MKYYLYRKDDGIIKMICDSLPQFDSSIFAVKQMNLDNVETEAFFVSGRRFIINDQLVLEARPEEQGAIIQKIQQDIEDLKAQLP